MRGATPQRQQGPAIERIKLAAMPPVEDGDSSSGTNLRELHSQDPDLLALHGVANYVSELCACPSLAHAPLSASQRSLQHWLEVDTAAKEAQYSRNFSAYVDFLGHSKAPYHEGSLLAARFAEGTTGLDFVAASAATTLC